jgi:hypothetical protein
MASIIIQQFGARKKLIGKMGLTSDIFTIILPLFSPENSILRLETAFSKPSTMWFLCL